MLKPQFGAMIEIPNKLGLAYAQYTHQHPQFGGLIRVFDRIFNERPNEFKSVAESPVRFSIFFPVAAALKKGIFKVVEHAPLTADNKRFPLFRDGMADPKTK